MGDNLHVTVRGVNGDVLQSACPIHPVLTCGAPINLGNAAFRMALLPSREHRIAILDR
ncbi:hypothetical protein NE235_36155 [Actinoallomurus spadix]|nr:hypothetical protein [Actinoallomurus spadix]MCO5991563.1 hypothetical protein [Actinoallomurus spadix]